MWQGGDPDRCPEVSGQRLLLTEAQMDINVYWAHKHFSAESGLFCRGPPIQVSEQEGWGGERGWRSSSSPL